MFQRFVVMLVVLQCVALSLNPGCAHVSFVENLLLDLLFLIVHEIKLISAK